MDNAEEQSSPPRSPGGSVATTSKQLAAKLHDVRMSQPQVNTANQGSNNQSGSSPAKQAMTPAERQRRHRQKEKLKNQLENDEDVEDEEEQSEDDGEDFFASLSKRLAPSMGLEDDNEDADGLDQVEEFDYNPFNAVVQDVAAPEDPRADDPSLVIDTTSLHRLIGCGAVLGFDSNPDMNNWLAQDPIIQKFWGHYLNEAAKDLDTAGSQRPQVLTRLVEGESHGMRKYSNAQEADRRAWRYLADWYAYLYFHFKLELVDTYGRRYFGLKWTNEVVQQRIWAIVQRLKSNTLKGTEKNDFTTAVMDGIQENMEDTVAPNDRNALTTAATQFGANLTSAMEKVQAKRWKSKKAYPKQKPSKSTRKKMTSVSKNIGLSEELTNALCHMTEDEWMEAFAQMSQDAMVDHLIAARGEMPTFFHRASNLEVERALLENHKIQAQADKVGNQLVYGKDSIRQKIWQLYIAYAAMTGDQNADLKKVSDLLKGLSTDLCSKAEKQDKDRFTETVADAEEAAQAAAENAAEAGKSETDYGMYNMYARHKDEASSSSMDRLMASKAYERTQLRTAARLFRIALDGKPLRLALMRNDIVLNWWQLCGACALILLHQAKWCRGGILADKVGLGKTITILVVILHQLETKGRLRMKKGNPAAPLKEEEKSKPWLILVPSTIMGQWAKEICMFSDYFRVYLYHSKGQSMIKQNNLDPNRVKVYKAELEKDARILQTRTNRIAIILCTPDTYAHRHGPRALDLHRKERYIEDHDLENIDQIPPLIKKTFEMQYHEKYDSTWPGDLEGKFEGVVVDEAHIIRTSRHRANAAVRWLDAPFVILATATPTPTGFMNATGYLNMLAGKANYDAYSDDSVDPYQMLRHFEENPLPADASDTEVSERHAEEDRHRRAALTPTAFRKWVCKTEGEVKHGRGLAIVFQGTMVRRTYPTFIPNHEDTTRISLKLPEMYKYKVAAKMTDAQKKLYERNTAGLAHRIYMTTNVESYGGSNGDEISDRKTNAAVLRTLTGNTDCPILGFAAVPREHVAFTTKEIKEWDQARYNANASFKKKFHALLIKHTEENRGEETEDGADMLTPSNATHESTKPVLEKVWYRDDEWNLFEANVGSWMAWYCKTDLARDVDPYVNMLLQIMRQIQKHQDKGPHGEDISGEDIVTDIPDPTDWKGLAAIAKFFMSWSPRLAVLIWLVMDCIKRDEKMVIWVNYPFEQYFVAAFLRCFTPYAAAFVADLDVKDRVSQVAMFNKPMNPDQHEEGAIQFLVCSYAVGGVGLNLQYCCNISVMYCQPETYAAGEQAIGRIYRLGQLRHVHVVQLFIPGSHDDWVFRRNMRRSLAEIHALIDDVAFAEKYGSGLGPQLEEMSERPQLRTVDLQGFVEFNGEVMRRAEYEALPSEVTSQSKAPSEVDLSPEHVLKVIFESGYGKLIKFNQTVDSEQVSVGGADPLPGDAAVAVFNAKFRKFRNTDTTHSRRDPAFAQQQNLPAALRTTGAIPRQADTVARPETPRKPPRTKTSTRKPTSARSKGKAKAVAKADPGQRRRRAPKASRLLQDSEDELGAEHERGEKGSQGLDSEQEDGGHPESGDDEDGRPSKRARTDGAGESMAGSSTAVSSGNMVTGGISDLVSSDATMERDHTRALGNDDMSLDVTPFELYGVKVTNYPSEPSHATARVKWWKTITDEIVAASDGNLTRATILGVLNLQGCKDKATVLASYDENVRPYLEYLSTEAGNDNGEIVIPDDEDMGGI